MLCFRLLGYGCLPVGIKSAKNLTTENCLSLIIYVLQDKEDGEYLSTFQLVLPEEDIDLDQYDALLEGISFSQFKIESLLESLELEEDDDSNDGEDDD